MRISETMSEFSRLEHDITSSNFAIKGGAVYIDDWVYIGEG